MNLIKFQLASPKDAPAGVVWVNSDFVEYIHPNSQASTGIRFSSGKEITVLESITMTATMLVGDNRFERI